jgi:cyclase
MTRTLGIRLSAGLVFLLAAWIAYTQTPPAPAKITVNKVKDDLFELVSGSGNVAVYVTDEGLILIDDKYDQDHEPIMEALKGISDKPVKYIITTHHHADHSGGNAKFVSSANIISTANARTDIVEKKQGNAPPGMVGAQITFTDETAVHLGGKEVRAKYFGRGHTNGDAVIYFPQLKTLHTGDLMAGNTPLIDYPGGGSVVEWTKTLDGALKLDFDTVIPGHGAVTNKAALLAYRNNVEKLRNRAQSMIREGKSQDEVGKVMTAEFNWAPTGLQFQWSLPGMMSELK